MKCRRNYIKGIWRFGICLKKLFKIKFFGFFSYFVCENVDFCIFFVQFFEIVEKFYVFLNIFFIKILSEKLQSFVMVFAFYGVYFMGVFVYVDKRC